MIFYPEKCLKLLLKIRMKHLLPKYYSSLVYLTHKQTKYKLRIIQTEFVKKISKN